MKNMSIHLSRDLIGKYGIKRFPVRKGDIVRVVKGDAEKDDKYNTVGKEGKVVRVLNNENRVVVENLNIAKADGKMKQKKFDQSVLILVRVNLDDKIRKAKLTSLASLRNKTVEEEPEEVPEPKEQEKTNDEEPEEEKEELTEEEEKQEEKEEAEEDE